VNIIFIDTYCTMVCSAYFSKFKISEHIYSFNVDEIQPCAVERQIIFFNFLPRFHNSFNFCWP